MTDSPKAASERDCDRCRVPMRLEPFYEGSPDECWYCPCCKSKLKTVEQLEAQAARRRVELGMTEKEYDAHCRSLIRKPTARDLEAGRAFAVRQAEEWQPPCEHVTNPWKAQA